MKKRLLLIMPRVIDNVGDWYYFQLGIAYVSASLKKAGFDTLTLNLNTTPGTVEAVVSQFLRDHPVDIVATGGITAHYASIRQILETTKACNPKTVTIVGGGIISSDPENAMRALEMVDYGVIGEAELAICELMQALEGGETGNNVKGLIINANEHLIHTPPKNDITDLDTLPFPDYKGFDFDKTISLESSLYDRNIKNSVVMVSSRSCPFRCTFCFHTSGQKFRQRSLNNFFEELDLLLQDYPIKYIYISDELFTYDQKRVIEFCQRIKPYDITWGIQARVTDITEEMVACLKEANCITIALGIESADNRILKSMKKHITIEQTGRALEIIYQSGIHIAGGFIFGDAEETLETANNTLNWWKQHTQYGLGLNFITTYPGTDLYRHALEKGIIKDPVQFIRDGSPTINVSRMSDEEVKYVSAEILRLTSANLKQPTNIELFTIDESGYRASFRGQCCYCGKLNDWTNVKLLHRSNICCNFCGTKHKTPIVDSVLRIMQSRLEALLARHGKLAFWGITDIGLDWMDQIPAVSGSSVFFIDTSLMKQNTLISGKRIHSPEIIRHQGITAVIIPVLSFFTEIKLQIENEFPEVTEILSMLKLMK